MDPREAAWAALHTPTTDIVQLTEIAGAHPEFASSVAVHPNATPELQAWARAVAPPQALVPVVPVTPVIQPMYGVSVNAYMAAPLQPTNGFAVTSMIFGILSYVLGLFLWGTPAILAVVFGHVALVQIKRKGGRGRGMAVAGLVLGYIAIGIAIVIVAFWVTFLAALAGAGSSV